MVNAARQISRAPSGMTQSPSARLWSMKPAGFLESWLSHSLLPLYSMLSYMTTDVKSVGR